MRPLDDFLPLLGTPVRQGDAPALERIGASWGVALLSDFVEIAGAYGDAVISEATTLPVV